jgi:hypothetical protein
MDDIDIIIAALETRKCEGFAHHGAVLRVPNSGPEAECTMIPWRKYTNG